MAGFVGLDMNRLGTSYRLNFVHDLLATLWLVFANTLLSSLYRCFHRFGMVRAWSFILLVSKLCSLLCSPCIGSAYR